MIGRIIKAVAGFFYVDTEGSGIYACRARGIFRKDGVTPLVGDMVEMEVTDPKDMEGNVTKILPRKSRLQRPACANIDAALLTVATKDPIPQFLNLDRMLVVMEHAGIPAMICLNKIDQDDAHIRDRIEAIYPACGYPVFYVSAMTGEGIGELLAALHGKMTVLAGPSGVGKSSLTNALCGKEAMEVGSVSQKLMRGKNTTRHIELLSIDGGGYILDTPGFSSLQSMGIEPDTLDQCFPEMRPYIGQCYFQGCAHRAEPDCAVKAALEEGILSASRYEAYGHLYDELEEEEKRRY